jgi:hypothetical protein
MFQSAEFRLATLALFVGLAGWLASSPAWAFSQENLRGGADSSSFSDPDDQVKNFGSGGRLFGPNGPIVQFGAQRGPLNPFGRFQGNTTTIHRRSLTPDPWATATESLARTYDSVRETYVHVAPRSRAPAGP